MPGRGSVQFGLMLRLFRIIDSSDPERKLDGTGTHFFPDFLCPHPKCNLRVLAIGNTGLHIRALRTPPLLSQPVQPRLTKRTRLPSLKQITSPKVLPQPLDIPISRTRHWAPLFLSRVTNWKPYCSSSAVIWRLKAGWLIRNRCAARVKFNSSAKTTTEYKCRTSSWEIVMTSTTAPGTILSVEANLVQTRSQVSANASSILLVNPPATGDLTFGGWCPNNGIE